MRTDRDWGGLSLATPNRLLMLRIVAFDVSNGCGGNSSEPGALMKKSRRLSSRRSDGSLGSKASPGVLPVTHPCGTAASEIQISEASLSEQVAARSPDALSRSGKNPLPICVRVGCHESPAPAPRCAPRYCRDNCRQGFAGDPARPLKMYQPA